MRHPDRHPQDDGRRWTTPQVVRGKAGHIYFPRQQIPDWGECVRLLKEQRDRHLRRASSALRRLDTELEAVRNDIAEAREYPQQTLGIDLMSFGHWPYDRMASSLRGQPLITGVLEQFTSERMSITRYHDAYLDALAFPGASAPRRMHLDAGLSAHLGVGTGCGDQGAVRANPVAGWRGKWQRDNNTPGIGSVASSLVALFVGVRPYQGGAAGYSHQHREIGDGQLSRPLAGSLSNLQASAVVAHRDIIASAADRSAAHGLVTSRCAGRQMPEGSQTRTRCHEGAESSPVPGRRTCEQGTGGYADQAGRRVRR